MWEGWLWRMARPGFVVLGTVAVAGAPTECAMGTQAAVAGLCYLRSARTVLGLGAAALDERFSATW